MNELGQAFLAGCLGGFVTFMLIVGNRARLKRRRERPRREATRVR